MAREKKLKELGKYVQDCKCGCMLAKKDFKKGIATCPRCTAECEKVKEAKDATENKDTKKS